MKFVTQKLNEDSIEFFLSTCARRISELSRLSYYNCQV